MYCFQLSITQIPKYNGSLVELGRLMKQKDEPEVEEEEEEERRSLTGEAAGPPGAAL